MLPVPSWRVVAAGRWAACLDCGQAHIAGHAAVGGKLAQDCEQARGAASVAQAVGRQAPAERQRTQPAWSRPRSWSWLLTQCMLAKH